MNKLEIKLKQHTPIIHFQHEQSGATLRASELKPKLDKYLIKYAFENNFDKYNKYLIGWEEGKTKEKYNNIFSFDYKVIIKEPINKISESIEKDKLDRNGRTQYDRKTNKPKKTTFPCFFGNLGEDEIEKKEKYFVFCESIIVEIFSFNEKLIQIIKRNIGSFFYGTNFGTRQSKGFGSFTVDSINNENYEIEPKYYLSWFSVEITKETFYDKQKELFSFIDMFYKTLRSGINEKRPNRDNVLKTVFYMKPVIFEYARVVLSAQWDKKTIKEEFYPTELNNQKSEPPLSDYPLTYNSKTKYLIKDLLGLSLLEDWKEPYKKKIKKISNESVERFQSPILIKPIKNDSGFIIYIYFNDIPIYYFNKSFEIADDEKSITLNTPPLGTNDEPVFSLYNFLFFAFKKVNISNLMPKDFKEKQTAAKIINIYNQLRTNFNKGE